MTFFPGDILTNITGLRPSTKRGQYQFRWAGIDCVLLDYVPTGRNGPVVEKAVCVGRNQNGKSNTYYFRLAKYSSRVMDLLYSEGQLQPLGNKSVQKRWRDLAHSEHLPRFQRYDPGEKHLKRFKAWRLALTDLWEMPIPVSEYNDCVIDSEGFMPHPLPYGQSQKFLSPCYLRMDEQLPRQFLGEWTDKSRLKRKVKIVLHGYLDPRKMHFGARKHVLGCLGEPSQAKNDFNNTLAKRFAEAGMEKPMEHDLWHRLLGEDFLAGFNCHAFQGCPEDKKKQADAANCPHCETERFGRVHRQIAPLLTRYCREFVTVLAQLATKPGKENLVNVWSENSSLADGGCVRIETHYQPWEEQTMKAIFGGVFYSGEGEHSLPVFHLSMMTLYFSNEQLFSPNNSLWCGTITLQRH